MRDVYQSHDYSIGVIPFCQAELDTYYLIIHHTKGHRGFPKGHAENLTLTQQERETPQQTALRELHEEAGVTQVVLGDQVYTEHYEFDHHGARVVKQVDYYLGQCDECRPITIQPEETVEAGWYTYDEAMSLLTFDEAKNLLKQVNKILTT